jgi:uncharacterized protein YjbI with pentapeptide repeats
MSEQQSQTATAVQATTTSACPHPEAVGERWGDPISEERQRVLLGYLDRWDAETDHGERKGPFDPAWHSDEERQRHKLTGADVFWLTARLIAGSNDDLSVASAKLRAASTQFTIRDRIDVSALHLEGAVLQGAHLEAAVLGQAHLEGADLVEAHMEKAHLYTAHLEGAHLIRANLEDANLGKAHLEAADLSEANLKNVHLGDGVHLEGAHLGLTHLEHANLNFGNLRQARLVGAHMEATSLTGVDLERAELRGAHLEGAHIGGSLESADLKEAHLEGASLLGVQLGGADLRRATFSAQTSLENIRLSAQASGSVAIADVHWGGVDLTRLDWDEVKRIGDERLPSYGSADKQRAVVRAYRQLAAQLRDQGLHEEADRFAERASICKRAVLLRRGPLGWPQFLFSWFLAIVAGYGYRPSRTLFWYVVTIAVFAFMYMQATTGWIPFGLPAPSQLAPLPWYEALILSVSSFHGRGFFQPLQSLGDPVAALAAIEAVIGLFIEISFIATFTQRYFGARGLSWQVGDAGVA